MEPETQKKPLVVSVVESPLQAGKYIVSVFREPWKSPVQGSMSAVGFTAELTANTVGGLTASTIESFLLQSPDLTRDALARGPEVLRARLGLIGNVVSYGEVAIDTGNYLASGLWKKDSSGQWVDLAGDWTNVILGGPALSVGVRLVIKAGSIGARIHPAVGGIAAVGTGLAVAGTTFYIAGKTQAITERLAEDVKSLIYPGDTIVVRGMRSGDFARRSALLTPEFVNSNPQALIDYKNGIGPIADWEEGRTSTLNVIGVVGVEEIVSAGRAKILLHERGVVIGKDFDLAAITAEAANALGRQGSLYEIAERNSKISSNQWINFDTYAAAGFVGSVVGSSLGRYIGGNDVFKSVGAQTVLSVIGTNLAQVIVSGGVNVPVVAVGTNKVSLVAKGALDDVRSEFFNSLNGAAVGTVSSLIGLELGRALGLDGFGGELLTTAITSVVGHVASNVAAAAVNLFQGLNPGPLFSGAAALTNLAGMVDGFLASKLSNLIISPVTKEGALFSAIGAAVGSYFLGPFVGTFIGQTVGTLVGRLFFGMPPKPWAAAEIALNLGTGLWDMGAVYAKHGASKDVVTSMALSARDSINGVIAMVGGHEDVVGVANPVAEKHKYRWDQAQGDYEMQELVGSTFVKRYDGKDPSAAVDIGVLLGIRDTLIVGGDLLMKRAILNYLPSNVLPTAEKDIITLLGNLQIAEDYGRYIRNPEPINRLMAANPSSAFTAAWAITLLRAEELELNRFNKSDFYGGFAGFVQSGYSIGETPRYEEYSVYNDDGWNIYGPNLGHVPGGYYGQLTLTTNDIARIGYNSVWQQSPYATQGNDWLAHSQVGTTYGTSLNVDGLGGDDMILGSYFADNISGSAGFDWLDGLEGNDKLNGGAGNDVLLGREGNDNLDGGDGDDYLSGGDGNDYFVGSTSNRLDGGVWGGNGNDTLVGGSGQDFLNGENGDDLLISTDDGTWDYYSGEAGNDTLSFERYGYGVVADLNAGRGSYWDPNVRAIAGNNIWSIESLTGTAFGDQLYGDEVANVLKGLAGNDYLQGREGDDTLEGGAGADILDGYTGTDTASYAGSASGVFVDLATGVASGGDASGDTFYSIENLTGSRFGDVLGGNAGNNNLRGGGGDDVLIASGGTDWLQGGDGFDAIDFSAAPAAVVFHMEGGWTVSGWGPSTHDNTVEKLIGSNHADVLRTGFGDQELEGGAGNDQLYGGSGNDTYIFAPGHGSDMIYDPSSGNDTIRFDGMNWRDLSFNGYQAYGGDHLTISTLGGAGSVQVYNHFPSRNSDGTVKRNSGSTGSVIKGIDLGGAGLVEIGDLDYMPTQGTAAGETLTGLRNKDDLLFAYGGNDTIYTSGWSSETETRGNVVYAGDGNDYISASTGDDQYIFERGNGIDTLVDTGGLDTIIMGPSVAAEDVSFSIVPVGTDGRANLEILVRDPANPSGPVVDKIIVVDGGHRTEMVYQGTTKPLNTVEYIRVGGQVIDLRKIDVPWSTFYDYSTPPGGGVIPPLVLDLDGDGVELRSVHGSRLAAVASDGVVYRTGWVGPDDGILALDRNGDGSIDRQSEISFVHDVKGAKTDLEGLAAYDTNSDGKLSADDKLWGGFQVWRDINQDGKSAAEELFSLDEVGVRSISLSGKLTGQTPGSVADSAIVATAAIEWADKSRTGDAYDVVLALEAVRTDGGNPTVLAGQQDARAKSSDAIEDNLYGSQALTKEQADVLAERRKALGIKDDELLFGRVEDVLADGISRIENGVWVASLGEKDGGLLDKLGAKNGDASDRYKADEWTVRGSQDQFLREESERNKAIADAGGFDRNRPDLAPTPEVAGDNEAMRYWKAVEEKQAAEKAQLDAASSVPTPTVDQIPKGPLPGDTFRRLTPSADVKASTGDALAIDQARASGNGASPAPAQAGSDSISGTNSTSVVSSATGGRKSSSTITRSQVQTSGDGSDSYDYLARIEAANSILVNAMASFGAPSRMMTTNALLQSTHAGSDPWITASSLPSVHRLAAA